MKQINSKEFREQIRIFERKLGLLKKNNESDCCRAVTLAQCHALVEIGRANIVSLSDLAAILTLDISTTSRTVDSLVKKDYVCRNESKIDRRSLDICLTECGKQLFHKIENKMDFDFTKVFDKIPADKHQMVIEALDLIINAL